MSCHFTRTACPPQSFLHALAYVKSDQECGFVAASDGWLQVYQISDEGALHCVAQQPVHGTVRALEAVLGKAGGTAKHDRLALLTDSDCITILEWDDCLERLVPRGLLPLPLSHIPGGNGGGGTDPSANPYRLLAVDPGGQMVAAAATFGTVSVFSLSTCGHTFATLDGGTAAAAAAGPAATSMCLRSQGSGDADSAPSLILSVACLGEVPAALTVRDSTRDESACGTEWRLAVLHQPTDGPRAISLLRYRSAPAASAASSVPGHPGTPPAASAMSAGGATSAGGVTSACDASLVEESRMDVEEVWGASPPRQLLAVPGTPDWVVVMHQRTLWLLQLGAGGLEEEGALVPLARNDTLITCCVWDPSVSASSGYPPAAAPDVADTMALALAEVAGTHGLPVLADMALAPAPADVPMGSPDDSALAPADMAMDVAAPPTPPDSSPGLQLGAAQPAHRSSGQRSSHSVTLAYSCEDGSLWRLDVAWGAAGLSSRPSIRSNLCYEGDVPARTLAVLPGGRMLYCPDSRDARLLQLIRVPDEVTSPREAQQAPSTHIVRSSSSSSMGRASGAAAATPAASQAASGQLPEGSLAAGPPPPLPFEMGGLEGAAAVGQQQVAHSGPLALAGSSGRGGGGGPGGGGSATEAERRLAVARHWLLGMQPELQRQLEVWLLERGGLQAVQSLQERYGRAVRQLGGPGGGGGEDWEGPGGASPAQEVTRRLATELYSTLPPHFMDHIMELYQAFQRESAGAGAGGAPGAGARGGARTLSPLRYAELATLPSTACVADALLADLEGLQQNQVYAVCCQGCPASAAPPARGGALLVLYPDPRPEAVFESGELGAEGVTGIWGLRRHAGEGHHSLVVISFVGGTRALQLEGGVFEDVTDQLELDSSCETLACGNLDWFPTPSPSSSPTPAAAHLTAVPPGSWGSSVRGGGVAAQVTPAGVKLFLPQGQAAAACGNGEGDVSMADLSGEAGAQGCLEMEGEGEGGEEGERREAGGWWAAPTGSAVSTAAVSGGVVLVYCTGSKDMVALVPSALSKGPSLVPVASLLIGREVSCISNIVSTPQAPAPVHLPSSSGGSGAAAAVPPATPHPHGRPCGSAAVDAVFAVGTYQPSVLLVRLQYSCSTGEVVPHEPLRYSGNMQLLMEFDPGDLMAGRGLPGWGAGASATSAPAPAPGQQQQEQQEQGGTPRAAGPPTPRGSAFAPMSPIAATFGRGPSGGLSAAFAGDVTSPHPHAAPRAPPSPAAVPPAVCASPRFGSPLAPMPQPPPGEPPQQLIPESLLLRALLPSPPGPGLAAVGDAPAAAAAEVAPPGSPNPAQPAAKPALGLAVAMGLRTGELLQAVVDLGGPLRGPQPLGPGQMPPAALSSLRVDSLGGMPVVLTALPGGEAAPGSSPGRGGSEGGGGSGGAGPCLVSGGGSAVALCDRVSLLHPVRPTGVLSPQALALLDVVKAAPLLLPSPEHGAGEHGKAAAEGEGPEARCYAPCWRPGAPPAPPHLLLPPPPVPPERQPWQQEQQWAQGGVGQQQQQQQVGEWGWQQQPCPPPPPPRAPVPPPPQLFLLCATAAGALKMVSLSAPAPMPLRSLPLLLQPRRMALHAGTGLLAVGGGVVQREEESVAGGHPAELAELHMVDPGTGAVAATYSDFLPGECITAMAAWEPPHMPSGAAGGSPGAAVGGTRRRGFEEERVGGTHPVGLGARLRAYGLHDMAARAEAIVASAEQRRRRAHAPRPPLRSHPIPHFDTDHLSPPSSPPAAHKPLGGLVVLGTSIPSGGSQGSRGWWGAAPGGERAFDDEQGISMAGRILLLQLVEVPAGREKQDGDDGGGAGTSGMQLVLLGESRLPGRITALCRYHHPTGGHPSSPAAPSVAAAAPPASLFGSSGGSSSAGGARSSTPVCRLLAGVGQRLVAFNLLPARVGAREGVSRDRWRLVRVHWLPTQRPILSLEMSPGGLVAAGDATEGVTLYRYVLPSQQVQQEPGQHAAPAAEHAQQGGAWEVVRRAARARRGAPQGPWRGAGEVGEGLVAEAADGEQRAVVGAVAAGGIGEPGPRAISVDAGGAIALAAPKFPTMETSLHTIARFNLGQTPAKLLHGSLEFQGGPSAAPFCVPGQFAAGESAVPGSSSSAAAASEVVVVTTSGSVVTLSPLPGAPQRAQQLQRALSRCPLTAPLSGVSLEQYRDAKVEVHTGRYAGSVYRHPAGSTAVGSGGLDSPPGSPLLGAEHAQHAGDAAQQAEQGARRMSLDEAGVPAVGSNGGGLSQGDGDLILDGDLLEQLQRLPDWVQRDLEGLL